jgi:hypothetical protein
LVKAANSRYKSIYDSTAGVVFLGAPHRGSNTILNLAGHAVTLIFKILGSRTDLLNLTVGSKELEDLDHEFQFKYICNDRLIDCICFYECINEYFYSIPIGPVGRDCKLVTSVRTDAIVRKL